MNSYQTVNAAFAAAGFTKQEAVRFGRRFEMPRLGQTFAQRFEQAIMDVAVGRWNDEDKARQLRLKGAGGVAAAAAGGTSWLR